MGMKLRPATTGRKSYTDSTDIVGSYDPARNSMDMSMNKHKVDQRGYPFTGKSNANSVSVQDSAYAAERSRKRNAVSGNDRTRPWSK